MSTPTVLSMTPTLTIRIPLSAPPWLTMEAAISPSTITEKYSAGPNDSATVASTGDRNTMTITPMMPPQKDAMAVMNSATPARPCCAMG